MSTIESIFKEAKTRCDLLRESIDRGLYDSPQPAKKNAFQEKLQEIIQDGQDQIKQYYKQKHGIKYRFKNKNAEDSDKERLFQMVVGYGEDLTNRLALLNYYIRNQSQLNDPKKCRDMSQSKCIRADNINDCYWVPGGNELGEWAMRQNGKGIVINKPEYIGVGANQKPRGCYPIRKSKNLKKLLTSRKNTRKPFRNMDEFNAMLNTEANKSVAQELTKKELNIMRLKEKNKSKNLTNAEIAENQINSSNTSKFTKAQLNRRKNRQSKKAQRKREMNAMLERLKKIKNNKRAATKTNRKIVSEKISNTKMMGGKKHKTRKKKLVKKTRKKRGGKRKMTAKQYWKSGRFSGKTWWMPRYMKSLSWFKDTLKYGIPI
jgi:hypothetical protein